MSKLNPIIITASLLLGFHNAQSQDCIQAQYALSGSAVDGSVNGYNGTVSGTSVATDRFGNESGAMSFDGVNDYILLPNDFDTPERTVNIWFKSDSIHPGNGMIFNIDHINLEYGSIMMRVFEWNGTKVIRMNGGGGGLSTSIEIPINETQWYMATIVMDSEIISYYLDCQLVGTSPNFQNHSQNGTSSAVIGTDRDFSPYYAGLIDDLTIFDCTLSMTEICVLYNAPNPLCLGDIDSNGIVDVGDFLLLNTSFGNSCEACPEDIDGDGLVDVNDYMILFSNFGNICPE